MTADPPLAFGRVALARVRRHEAWFTARCLHAREQELACAFLIPKRRHDFIAGRAAARRALTRLGHPDGFVLPSSGADAGAPRAYDAAGAPVAVALSISHGAGWAVAVAANDGRRVGVDLERVEPRAQSFVDEAFAAGELARWAEALGAAASDPRVVTVAWCAKEALLKIDGRGLRAALPAIVPDAIAVEPARAGEPIRGRLHAPSIGTCDLAVTVDAERALVIVWCDHGRL